MKKRCQRSCCRAQKRLCKASSCMLQQQLLKLIIIMVACHSTAISAWMITSPKKNNNNNNNNAWSSSRSILLVSLQQAASSSDLRNNNNKQDNDNDGQQKEPHAKSAVVVTTAVTCTNKTTKTTYSKNSVVSRLHRAAARAAQQKKQRQAAAKCQQLHQSTIISSSSSGSNNNDDDDSQLFLKGISSISSSTTRPPKKIATLTQLTSAIDEQLVTTTTGARSRNHHHHSHHNNIRKNNQARDSMTAVVQYNYQDKRDDDNVVWLSGKRPATAATQTVAVAIVWGKALVQDQISVDYASRLLRLVRALRDTEKDDDKKLLQLPTILCFLNDHSDETYYRKQRQQPQQPDLVSVAQAGYLFFRHACTAQGVSLDHVSHIYLEPPPSDDKTTTTTSANQSQYQALQNVMQYVRNQCLVVPSSSSLLDKEQHDDDDDDPEPTVYRLHFWLVSNDYHLCQFHETHLKSPDQSPLRALQQVDDDKVAAAQQPKTTTATTATSWNKKNKKNAPPLVEKTRWTYLYATTTTADVVREDPYYDSAQYQFFLKIFRTVQQLHPVVLNLQAVVDHKEFFQQENYLVLVSARRSLVADMETIYQAQPSLKAMQRMSWTNDSNNNNNNNKPTDVVLESALLSLGRCLDLVRPAGLLTGSVPARDWKLACHVLTTAVEQICITCRPDEQPYLWRE